MLGWATGGLVFGALGDRLGRARCLSISILLYAVCTGLSAFSTGPVDFCIYRLITGVALGGSLAWPWRSARMLCLTPRVAHALTCQALSAVGNMIAAFGVCWVTGN